MKTTASTHTGGALFEIGAMMAGLKPTWGVEIRPDIAGVAERNIPGLSVIRSDVALVDWSSLEPPYHFHSSPSCKNASNANSDGEEVDEDIASAMAICKALRILRPPVFTLENVWFYRNFESFEFITTMLTKLGYIYTDWWHLNFANYGVPQTRKRLILIARRDRQQAMPPPTHSSMPDPWGVYKPWVGWYEAIEDLIPELPISTRADCELCQLGRCMGHFADWQADRLPEELRTILLAQGAYDGEVVNRSAELPAMTITANGNQSGVKAFLMRAGNANQAGQQEGRWSNMPAMTITGSKPRAFVVGSQYGQPNTVQDRPPQIRRDNEPYFTVTVSGSAHGDQRAFAGRVVKMTPRALARFQSIPDTYLLPASNGLACEIVGNAVPPLLAKAICEAIR